MTEKLISDGLVLLDLDADGVGHLRLNRPEASNGMNVPFLRALHDAVMAAHGEPRLRVLLLTGEGPNFCAGGDVKTFASRARDCLITCARPPRGCRPACRGCSHCRCP